MHTLQQGSAQLQDLFESDGLAPVSGKVDAASKP